MTFFKWLLASTPATKAQLMHTESIAALELPPNPFKNAVELLGGPSGVAEIVSRLVQMMGVASYGSYPKVVANSERPDVKRDRVNIEERHNFMQISW